MVDLPDKKPLHKGTNFNEIIQLQIVLHNMLCDIIDYLEERKQPKQNMPADKYKKLWDDANAYFNIFNVDTTNYHKAQILNLKYELALQSADKLIKKLYKALEDK